MKKTTHAWYHLGNAVCCNGIVTSDGVECRGFRAGQNAQNRHWNM